MLKNIETYFTSWRFPSFMLVTLALSWAAVMFMAFVPVSDTAWGAFAEDFKVWCFGYDPETSSMQWIYIFMYTINPFILALVILFVWSEPMKEVYAAPSITKKHASMAVMLVATVSASFVLMFEVPSEEQFEFRPDALRIALTPPDFTLVNQVEESVTLSDYRDKVVIITSVYASCGETCPIILEQARNVLRDLTAEEREEVVLMAITMQPEKDTPDLLRQVSRFYRLDDYNAHLLTGEVDHVNNTLDRFNVARYERDGSADLDHANLFIIIDRGGKIAYRFTIGERQQDWMTQALRVLINERSPENLTESIN